MKNSRALLTVIKYFLGWRTLLFVTAFVAVFLITNFGGKFPYADRVLTPTGLPSWIWGFGNFDGVHYLRIAQNGYSAEYSQAFFPLYPILIRLFNFFPKSGLDLKIYTDPSYFYTGMFLSAIFFILALFFLFKLWKEEYGQKISLTASLLLLSFPSAFYFGAIYSESLFLLLAVLTFWFVKKGKFVVAGTMACLASATKVQGALLFIFLAIEFWEKYKNRLGELKKSFMKDLFGVFISPLGLLGYMYYLYKAFGDPINFLTAQPAFGAQRSSLPLVSLPQVIYRYIKMLLTVDPANVAYWNVVLEMVVTLILIGALIYAFRKLKFSYWLFVAVIVVLPTMTGTLSSMPRYALMAFPLLPLIAKFNIASRYIIIAQVLLEMLLVAIFTRGYWVA
ncbi:hypothetical protein A2393_02360 [Candidatus Woesebacteria bacterium RIFOXYB1_FULL_41_13]|uniref:Glycosyltransferase RgtA/B/C/D-like domain-containing protein n=1 Tax=Candidatus Woesebacteria bacterium RIFOXYB1_FULL_41_13 TaxID=1802540 RepID=A0A1F8CXU3_9BACT|nr:MAG: hypothetical protein A2393_02360 [Candidatus Woesebacteria bacterium RIFOXYB1_FULL_41_13]